MIGRQQEITTIADWPCAAWTERREAESRQDPPQMWLVGYLTGMASAFRIDALAVIDAPRIFAWMDARCRSHPDDTLSAGAQVLFRQLIDVVPQVAPQP